MSYYPSMPLDYMQMLLDLMEERQQWQGRRDEAIREISRLSELIRATINMIPPEKLARYEPIFERIEQRPAGLAAAIRACFSAGGFHPAATQPAGPSASEAAPARGWLTPVEIRDALKRMGFPFENYKANPLASIHTTLKRMVPGEMEVRKQKNGQQAYRLKRAGEWQQAFAEIRQWLREDLHLIQTPGAVVVKKPERENAPKEVPPDQPENRK